LIFTKSFWVPKLVDYILQIETPAGKIIKETGENFIQADLTKKFFSQKLETFVDKPTSLTFEYPEKILTKYVTAIDWPPKAQILQQPFVCNEEGNEIDRAGQTKKQTINGRDYCVTKESEGAAGSIYTNYAYAFPYNNITVVLTFSLRFVQCANYDEPQQSACLTERALFNPDNALDQIANSLIFKL